MRRQQRQMQRPGQPQPVCTDRMRWPRIHSPRYSSPCPQNEPSLPAISLYLISTATLHAVQSCAKYFCFISVK
jgi:hypothetical protein